MPLDTATLFDRTDTRDIKVRKLRAAIAELKHNTGRHDAAIDALSISDATLDLLGEVTEDLRDLRVSIELGMAGPR